MTAVSLGTYIAEVRPYSDMTDEGLMNVAKELCEAHTAVRDGLTIEVGTRRGGSAKMILEILLDMYAPDKPPMLFTVDPYGYRPYRMGDVVIFPGPYGERDYVAQKKLLAEYPHHAHWRCDSQEFFKRCLGMTHWHLGEESTVENIAFALLDGQHDGESVAAEIDQIIPFMARGGRIVIDNAEKAFGDSPPEGAFSSIVNCNGLDPSHYQATLTVE